MDADLAYVREMYPTIHITAAISNISFNLPVRKLINLGFTVLAMNAGLDSGILDPTNRDMLGLIYATEDQVRMPVADGTYQVSIVHPKSGEAKQSMKSLKMKGQSFEVNDTDQHRIYWLKRK